MARPFACSCGRLTREPYLVNGQLMCVLCAEQVAPHLVDARTVRDWQAFISPMKARKDRRDYEKIT